jgi:DNA-binding protein HU-beta
MNQGELIQIVAEEAGISIAKAERAINSLKGAITQSLRKGETVKLVGFGTFSLSHRKARRAYDGHRSKIIKVPSKKSVRFSVGKNLSDVVNKRRR